MVNDDQIKAAVTQRKTIRRIDASKSSWRQAFTGNELIISLPKFDEAPRYEKQCTLQSGQMGVVSAAVDRNVNRLVALKRQADGEWGEEELLQFIEEAQITGQLIHPNIVPVYDIGTDSEGQYYYTMKMVRGRTLCDIISAIEQGDTAVIDAFPLAALLRVFQKVCDAVAYAHSRNVVHLDLKPENVMIGDFGEVMVLDWGIAKIMDADSGQEHEASAFHAPVAPVDDTVPSSTNAEPIVSADSVDDPPVSTARTQSSLQTSSNTICGTLHYMPPEQAVLGHTDARSDIYALGGILYAILTLRLFRNFSSIEEWQALVHNHDIIPPVAYNAVTNDDAPALSHLPRGQVPTALSAVAMKALAKEPQDRYQSVSELQADINAYQDGFPTVAEHAGISTQLLLFMRRNRKDAVTYLFGLVAAFAVLTLAGFYGYNEAVQLAEWGLPIDVERFSAGTTWPNRWQVVDGQAEPVDGQLVTRKEAAFTAYFDRKLYGSVAIEFDGQVLPGHRPGDLSVVWGSVDNDGRYRPTTYLQTGAWSNAFARIRHQRRQVDYSQFKLQPGRRYRIRAELDGYSMALFVDGKLVCEHTDVLPIQGGYIGLYGYYDGKAFDNIRIYNKTVAQRVSVLEIGDALLRRELYQHAISEYEKVIVSHPGKLLAMHARHKQAICHTKLGNHEESARLATELLDSPLRYEAELLLFDELLRQGKVDELLARMGQLHAVESSSHQRQIGTRWAEFILEASDDRVRERLLTFGRSHFGEDPRHRETFAKVLQKLGRYEAVIGDYPDVVGTNAWVLGALGRPMDILERYPAERASGAHALLASGQPHIVLERYPDMSVEYAQALIDSGQASEVFQRFPENQEKVIAALTRMGRFEEILERYPDNIYARFRALLALGRNREVLSLAGDSPHFRWYAIEALLRTGRSNEISRRFVDQPALSATTLFRLGRYDDLLASYPEQSFWCSRTLAELGDVERLQRDYPHRRSDIALAMINAGRAPEALELVPWDHARSFRAYLEAGMFNEIVERYPGQPVWQATALLKMGRTQEVLERFPFLRKQCAQALLAAGQNQAVLATYPQQRSECAIALHHLGHDDVVLTQYTDVRSSCAAALAERGDVRAIQNQYGDQHWLLTEMRLASLLSDYIEKGQLSLIDQMGEFRHDAWMPILTPFLRNLTTDNRRQTMASYHDLQTRYRYLGAGNVAYMAGLIGGAVELDEFRAQPLQHQLAGREHIALALRAELDDDCKAAIHHYDQALALPGHERSRHLPLRIFIEWRLERLRVVL